MKPHDNTDNSKFRTPESRATASTPAERIVLRRRLVSDAVHQVHILQTIENGVQTKLGEPAPQPVTANEQTAADTTAQAHIPEALPLNPDALRLQIDALHDASQGANQ